MKEYLTEAIVLGTRPTREQDLSVDLYTKDFGRLRAKAIGGRRPLSKFSPHLNALNLVTVRLVRKNAFTVTDVAARDPFRTLRQRPKFLAQALELVFLMKAVLPRENPDLNFWYFLGRTLKAGRIDIGRALKLLGYDMAQAQCEDCGAVPATHFFLGDQSFLCARCFIKFPKNEIISLL